MPQKQETDEFNLLFAGNLGTAQNIETIIEAAQILKDESVVFHIVGDGSEIEHLKQLAANLRKVIFYGRKPLEHMPKYYEMADAMIVTLTDDPIISLTLPGKVQTYMAAGRPIVGAIDGETQLVLNESQGAYCGKAKDAVLLAENILKLKMSRDAVEIGRQNREYYENNFSKIGFMKKLINIHSF